MALDKEVLAECLTLGKDLHSTKAVFAECLALGKGRHSAKIGRGLTASSGSSLSSAPRLALGKIIFFLFLPPIFFEALVHYHKQHV